MREKPRDESRLRHMLDAMQNIEDFLTGKTAEDFLTDKILYFAIVKNFEIIGEAAYMLTAEFRGAHPRTPWADIIRMRHVMVHGYYHIDSRIVWHAIHNDFKALKEQLLTYLNELS